MKLNVSKIIAGNFLSEYLPDLFSCEKGLLVAAQPGLEAGYKIAGVNSDSVSIEYAERSDLMTALGDIIAGDAEKNQNKDIIPAMDFRGVMLDCSRNGVPKVEFIKKALCRLALMGLNYFCLYTEDTYEVEGEPLFGFGRGRYTKDELKELDAFGQEIGVTLFPCIQVLGHFANLLKYKNYDELKDNDAVLNVRKEETYRFIEKIIDNATEPYTSNMIHIGTDEPWGLGRGNSLDFDNPVKPGELYARHIADMGKMLERKGLKGIIWGDYLLGQSGEEALSEEEMNIISKDVILDYWGYAGTDVEGRKRDLAVYQNAGYDVMFSPGVWNWNRFFPNMKGANESSGAFFKAAHDMGAKKALTTMWGDDGQECLFDLNYPTLACYLADCRTSEPDTDFWMKRAELICGMPEEECGIYVKIENPDLEVLTCPNRTNYASTAKFLFYDDPLLSLLGKKYSDDSPSEYYASVAAKALALEKAGNSSDFLKLARLYSEIISRKIKLSSDARKAYSAEDNSALSECSDAVPPLLEKLSEFHKLYKTLWMAERKAFGMEVVDNRLGGLKARLETFADMIQVYVEGELDSIAEFELEIPESLGADHFNCYSRICTCGFAARW